MINNDMVLCFFLMVNTTFSVGILYYSVTGEEGPHKPTNKSLLPSTRSP